MDPRTDRAGRTKRALIAAVWVVAAIVLVLDIAWLVFSARIRSAQRTPEPKEPPQAATSAPLPAPARPTLPESPTVDSPAAGVTATPVPPEPGDRVPATGNRIVYRLGATLYVADGDGSRPTPVARVADGPYALSPDGRTVAVVADQRLLLIDVATGARIDVGLAVQSAPVWLPDSSAVLYVRRGSAGDQVRRVQRSGQGDALLTAGFAPSVSPNGRAIAVLNGDSDRPKVLVSTGGRPFKQVTFVGGAVTALAVGDDRLYVGLVGEDGMARLLETALDGSRARRLAGEPAGEAEAVWGALCLAPDGRHLGAVAVGDDQYSRISVIRLADGAVVRVPTRRDAYPRCWSASGDHLYYVEGNAYQGEPTVLYRVSPDGTGRRQIATGAR